MKQLLKKSALLLGVAGVYLVYSVGIRHDRPMLAKPSSLGSPNSSPSTRTGNSGGGRPVSSVSSYKDGIYTGSVANAYYGNVQVAVTIAGGQITDVKFLQYPDTHTTSVFINNQAMPFLKQEAIQAQSANVQIITGATYTSEAFNQSLQAALTQART